MINISDTLFYEDRHTIYMLCNVVSIENIQASSTEHLITEENLTLTITYRRLFKTVPRVNPSLLSWTSHTMTRLRSYANWDKRTTPLPR